MSAPILSAFLEESCTSTLTDMDASVKSIDSFLQSSSVNSGGLTSQTRCCSRNCFNRLWNHAGGNLTIAKLQHCRGRKGHKPYRDQDVHNAAKEFALYAFQNNACSRYRKYYISNRMWYLRPQIQVTNEGSTKSNKVAGESISDYFHSLSSNNKKKNNDNLEVERKKVLN